MTNPIVPDPHKKIPSPIDVPSSPPPLKEKPTRDRTDFFRPVPGSPTGSDSLPSSRVTSPELHSSRRASFREKVGAVVDTMRAKVVRPTPELLREMSVSPSKFQIYLDALIGLGPTDIAQITPEMLADHYFDDKVSYMRPDQIRHFSPEQFHALIHGRIRHLSPEHLAYATPDQFKAISSEDLPQLLPEQVGAITADQLAGVDWTIMKSKIVHLSPNAIGSVPATHLKNFDLFEALDIEQITGLGNRQLVFLSKGQIESLKIENVHLLPPATLAKLAPSLFKRVSNDELEKLSIDHILALSHLQQSELSNDQLKLLVRPGLLAKIRQGNLTEMEPRLLALYPPEEIQNIDIGILRQEVTKEQLSKLKPEVLAAIQKRLVALRNGVHIGLAKDIGAALAVKEVADLSVAQIRALDTLGLLALEPKRVLRMDNTQLQAILDRIQELHAEDIQQQQLVTLHAIVQMIMKQREMKSLTASETFLSNTVEARTGIEKEDPLIQVDRDINRGVFSFMRGTQKITNEDFGVWAPEGKSKSEAMRKGIFGDRFLNQYFNVYTEDQFDRKSSENLRNNTLQLGTQTALTEIFVKLGSIFSADPEAKVQLGESRHPSQVDIIIAPEGASVTSNKELALFDNSSDKKMIGAITVEVTYATDNLQALCGDKITVENDKDIVVTSEITDFRIV